MCMAGSRVMLWMNCRFLTWGIWNLPKGKGASSEGNSMRWLWFQSLWSSRAESLPLKYVMICSFTTPKPTPGRIQQYRLLFPFCPTTVWPQLTHSSLKRNLSMLFHKYWTQYTFSGAKTRKATFLTQCIKWIFRTIISLLQESSLMEISGHRDESRLSFMELALAIFYCTGVKRPKSGTKTTCTIETTAFTHITHRNSNGQSFPHLSSCKIIMQWPQVSTMAECIFLAGFKTICIRMVMWQCLTHGQGIL